MNSVERVKEICKERKIPILGAVGRGKAAHGIHIGLVVLGILHIGAGQRGGDQHQADVLLFAELGNAGQVRPAKR